MIILRMFINNIVIDYAQVAKSLGFKDVKYIPISALNGDNIVEKSSKFPGTKENLLLNVLENVEVESDINLTDASFPVQYVIRPQTETCMITGVMQEKLSVVFIKKEIMLLCLPSGLKQN